MKIFYVLLVTTSIIHSCGDKKTKESETASSKEADVCQGSKGVLLEQSTGTESSGQEVADNIVPDIDIAALDIEGPRAKLGNLFCLRITLKDTAGKAIKAKEGGQIITFNYSSPDDVRLLHFDFANNKAIPVLKLKVEEGQDTVVLSDLTTFNTGKLKAELGDAKGELEIGIIDVIDKNVIAVESMTFTEAGSNKIAVKLQTGFTLPTGYDAYFMSDKDGRLIAAAEGTTARPTLSENEAHITFSADVTEENHVFIIYGEHKNMCTMWEAICPFVGEEQKCPEHVTE